MQRITFQKYLVRQEKDLTVNAFVVKIQNYLLDVKLQLPTFPTFNFQPLAFTLSKLKSVPNFSCLKVETSNKTKFLMSSFAFFFQELLRV